MSGRTGNGLAAPLIVAQPEAVLFDMDGVITETAKAHAAAWQRLFDEFLKARAERHGKEFRPFDPAAITASMSMASPAWMASEASSMRATSICRMATRTTTPTVKRYADSAIARTTTSTPGSQKICVYAYPGTLELVKALRRAGVKTAVFSASRNAEAVLRNTDVLGLFDARVDGRDAAELNLPGKPDPAMLLEAARRLGTAPRRTAVVEEMHALKEHYGSAVALHGAAERFVLGVGRHRQAADPASLCDRPLDEQLMQIAAAAVPRECLVQGLCKLAPARSGSVFEIVPAQEVDHLPVRVGHRDAFLGSHTFPYFPVPPGQVVLLVERLRAAGFRISDLFRDVRHVDLLWFALCTCAPAGPWAISQSHRAGLQSLIFCAGPMRTGLPHRLR